MRLSSAQTFIIFLVFLLQQISCLRRDHQPQWPPALATLYNALRRCKFSTYQRPINWLGPHTTDDTEWTYWQDLLYEQAPAKIKKLWMFPTFYYILFLFKRLPFVDVKSVCVCKGGGCIAAPVPYCYKKYLGLILVVKTSLPRQKIVSVPTISSSLMSLSEF